MSGSQLREKICCGYSLNRGSRLVGYSDIGVQILGIILHLFVLLRHSSLLECITEGIRKGEKVVNCTIDFSEIGRDNKILDSFSLSTDSENNEIAAITVNAGTLLIHVVELLMVTVLFKGAKQRSEKKLNVWVVFTLIFTVLETGTFIGNMSIENNKLVMSYTIPSIVYKLYSMGVVKSFSLEFRESGSSERSHLNENDTDKSN